MRLVRPALAAEGQAAAASSAAPAAAAPAPTGAPAAPAAAAPAPTTPAAPAAAAAPADPAKPAGDAATPKEPGADASKAGASKDAAAPAAELKLTVPEGVKVDPAALDGFKSTVKELGLNEKQAQGLIDFQAKLVKTQEEAYTQAAQRQRVADLEALKGDKDFGGAKFDATVAAARDGVRRFGGEGLSKLLEASGLDCNPEVVKAFARAAQAIAEDGTAGRLGGGDAPVVQAKPQTITERIAANYGRKK